MDVFLKNQNSKIYNKLKTNLYQSFFFEGTFMSQLISCFIPYYLSYNNSIINMGFDSFNSRKFPFTTLVLLNVQVYNSRQEAKPHQKKMHRTKLPDKSLDRLIIYLPILYFSDNQLVNFNQTLNKYCLNFTVQLYFLFIFENADV